MNLYKVQYLNADGGYISTQYIPAPSAAEAVDRVRYEDEYEMLTTSRRTK